MKFQKLNIIKSEKADILANLISNTEVIASKTGVVNFLGNESRWFVRPIEQGTAILEIVDPHQLMVVADLTTQEKNRIETIAIG